MGRSVASVHEDAEVVRERLAHAALHGVWVVEAIAALDRLVAAAVGADEQPTSVLVYQDGEELLVHVDEAPLWGPSGGRA